MAVGRGVGCEVIINSHYNSSISYHVLSIFRVEGSVLHYRAFLHVVFLIFIVNLLRTCCYVSVSGKVK